MLPAPAKASATLTSVRYVTAKATAKTVQDMAYVMSVLAVIVCV